MKKAVSNAMKPKNLVNNKLLVQKVTHYKDSTVVDSEARENS